MLCVSPVKRKLPTKSLYLLYFSQYITKPFLALNKINYTKKNFVYILSIMCLFAGVLPIGPTSKGLGILLAQEGDGTDRGLWGPLGGTPHDNETPTQTAAREAFEESMGILGSISAIEKCIIRADMEFINADADAYFYFVYTHPNNADLIPVEFRYRRKLALEGFIPSEKEDMEIMNLKWVFVDDVKYLPLRPSFIRSIEEGLLKKLDTLRDNQPKKG